MSQPKYYGLNELREMFLHFFETKGHLRLPSFSLIPQNDASLLLINSGMAPMKPFFTGEQDMLAANNWNVCQYAVLVHMFAQVSGLKAGELVHVIADAHIYDRHIPIIEKMLSEPEHPAPQFTLDPAVTDFYAFTPDSVRLENYQFSPFEDKIPIAV